MAADPPSILDPRGPGAERIEGLWWFMLWVAAAVFAVVLVLLAIAVFKSRRPADTRTTVPWGEPFVVIVGVIIPSLILAGVFVVSLREMRSLSARADDARLEIEVVGHDWWWEVSYPGTDAVTANEIHIPVGEPVRLALTSDDVIHSFWVPQLQAKTDMIPGRTTHMWIEADDPGRYRGLCAEFCGLQHANMQLFVVAEPRADFEAWLDNEARPAFTPAGSSEAQGADVFLSSTCVGCHSIRGTDAVAELGPDLTHLAARPSIASGILDNTRANLARLITDPQEVKPGIAMPPTQLSPEDLAALLDYLEALK